MRSCIGVVASALAAFLFYAAAAEAKTVTLGPSDNRTDVSLNLGDTLTVELPASVVPGFRWVLHLPKQAPLTALTETANPAAEGKTATVQFRFNAAVAGDTLLAFGFESAKKVPGAAPQDISAFSAHVHVALGAPSPGTAVLFGVYKGTMPCADCSGLDTTLRLYSKGKYDTTYAFYIRTQTYRGAPHGDLTLSDRGVWGIERGDANNVNATVYRLNPDDPQHAESLLAEENGAALVQLDRNQKPIESRVNLTLRRVP